MTASLAIEPRAWSGSEARQGEDGSSSSPMTLLTLPAPPSVNNMFKNVRGVGRVKAPVYERWLAECSWRLRAQNPEPVHGPVVIVIGIERTSLMADVDNRIKALFDLIVAHGVIDDDRHVVGFAAAWSPSRDGLARLAIMPAANLTAQFHLASDGAHGGWFVEAPQPEEGAA